MSISHLWNITVDIQRPTVTQGAHGEPEKTWVVIFNDIRGRLQKRKMVPIEEAESLGRDATFADFNFYCDTIYSILATDRVIFGSRTFEVLGFDNSNQMDIFQKLELEEIK